MPDLDDLTVIQQEKFDGSLFLGKEIGVAARLMAIHVSSTGTQILHLDDDEPMQFGSLNSDGDVALAWDGSNLELLPAVDDTGAFNIGDGTTDMDFKVFMGATTSHVLFDNSAELVTFTKTRMIMGAQGTGVSTSSTALNAFEVHALTASAITADSTGLSCGIRCRYEIGAAQTNQVSLIAVEGRLRIKAAVADGAHAGVNAGIEADAATAFTGTSTTQRSAGHFYLELGSTCTFGTTSGWLTGVCIDSSIHATQSGTGNITIAGLRIKKSTSKYTWQYGIYLDASATTTAVYLGTATTGINFAGDFTDCIIFGGTVTGGKCIDFAGVTLAAGSSNNLFSYGDGVGAEEVTITDYWFPARMNVASIANPSGEKLASLLFLKFATTTAHQANLDIQGIGLTIDVGKNVGYAHAIEGLVDVSATATTTTGTLIGGKFTIELSAGATMTLADNGSAILGLIKGTGTHATSVLSIIEARKEGATTADNGIWINVLTGGTLTDGIHFGGAGTITNAIRFDSSVVTVGTSVSAHGGTLKTVKCDIDGTSYYLILSTSPS